MVLLCITDPKFTVNVSKIVSSAFSAASSDRIQRQTANSAARRENPRACLSLLQAILISGNYLLRIRWRQNWQRRDVTSSIFDIDHSKAKTQLSPKKGRHGVIYFRTIGQPCSRLVPCIIDESQSWLKTTNGDSRNSVGPASDDDGPYNPGRARRKEARDFFRRENTITLSTGATCIFSSIIGARNLVSARRERWRTSRWHLTHVSLSCWTSLYPYRPNDVTYFLSHMMYLAPSAPAAVLAKLVYTVRGPRGPGFGAERRQVDT